MFDRLRDWSYNVGNGRVVDPPFSVVVDLASLLPLGPRSVQHPGAKDLEGLTELGLLRER